MKIRDRIKEFRRIRADQLLPNPKNWRVHPEKQRNILQGILAEIGYADALLVRELSDGSLQLIDGHLRAETTPEQEVPVLILDLDEKEADKLLALFDPIGAIAQQDSRLLEELVEEIESSNESLQSFLKEMLENGNDRNERISLPENDITLPPHLFQIIIECEEESQQRELYEEFIARNLNARISNL